MSERELSRSPVHSEHSGSLKRRTRSRSYSYSRSRSRSKGRKYSRKNSRSRSRSRRRYSRSRSRSTSRSRRHRGRRHTSHSASPLSSRRRHIGNRVRHIGNRENPPTSRCLGVFGLSLHTSERELREAFYDMGDLESVQIVYDRKSGRSRGFGFVYFERREDAEKAKEKMTGAEIDGRRIRVDYSITERAHTPTPGVYMGRPTDRRGGGGGGGGGGSGGGPGGRRYRPRNYGFSSYDRSPSPYYRHSYSRSRSRSYSPRRY